MKRGFTLMELIIVIIIIGILASVGFGQYQRLIERGRAAEAKAILGQIRTAEEAYKTEFGTYNLGTGVTVFDNSRSMLIDAGITAGTCDIGHYFSYALITADETSFSYTATRCTAGGKNPQFPGAAPYTMTIDQLGAITASDDAYL